MRNQVFGHYASNLIKISILKEVNFFVNDLIKCVFFSLIYVVIFYCKHFKEKIPTKIMSKYIRTNPNQDDIYLLYNVIDDPNETEELSEIYPDLFLEMKAQMNILLEDMVPKDVPEPVSSELLVDELGNLKTGWC